MNIKLVNNYSTDIKDIITLTNKENAYFISSWDKSDNLFNLDSSILKDCLYEQKHKNTYIMSKDMYELKNKIFNHLIQNNIKVFQNEFTIVSNGTSAAFISVLQAIKNKVDNFLCIGPIYFTYLQLINILNKNLFYYNINLFQNEEFDLSDIYKEILDKKIKCILLIQPFFGSGINITFKELDNIISFCESNSIFLLIDYVYGNMEWDEKSHIHNYQLIERVISSQYCIMYESISKRIFLNGVKNALIFGSSNLIQKINTDSEICLGSLSYIQESLLDTLYLYNNLNKINCFISDMLTYAQNNYKLLKTLCMGSNILFCNTNSGYFTLVAIPTACFCSTDDKGIMEEIYCKTGIVTIPHSRYNYHLPQYYCFRINLISETDRLINAFRKFLDICSN